MTNKTTHKDFYNAIIAMAKGEPTEVSADAIVEFAEGRISALEKKSANRKPSKASEETIALKSKVVEVLGTVAEPVTVSGVLALSSDFAGISNQKMTAVLKALVDDGKVVNTKDKKTSLWTLAE